MLLFSMFTNKASTPETNLFYLVKTPVLNDKPAPLLLLLHGYASNEADLFSFANALPSKYLVVSARGPLTVGSDGYAWYNVTFKDGKPVYNFDVSEQSRLKIISFIETLKERYIVVSLIVIPTLQTIIFNLSIENQHHAEDNHWEGYVSLFSRLSSLVN